MQDQAPSVVQRGRITHYHKKRGNTEISDGRKTSAGLPRWRVLLVTFQHFKSVPFNPIKELVLLDGGFVVSGDGVCVSACRYIEASVEGIKLPPGLGSRHVAAVSITKRTRSVAVVVSESAIVRVFYRGEIISRTIPEVWLLSQHNRRQKGARREDKRAQVEVACETVLPA